MIAARLSSVWQVAGVAGAALCCYLVSQSVAAERANLAKVDRQIASAHDEIAKLKTEIGARSRLTQLDSWNASNFGLKAPRAAQFMDSGVQLASLYGHHGAPAAPLDATLQAQRATAQMAAYHAPAPAALPTAPAPKAAEAPTPVAPQPVLRTATYVRPKPAPLAGMDAAPTLTRAAYHPVSVAPAQASSSSSSSSGLLPDDIGDLIAKEEKADAKGGKAKRAKADR